nr:PAS domain S-box protein [Methanosarcina horonobensis]
MCLKIRASIGVPRLKGGRLTSVLAVHSSKPHHWTDAEIELVREVGDRIFTEIERARAEKALRESERRYRAVIENSKDAIIVTDPEGERNILSVNPAAAEMFGWAEQEMIGLTQKHILDMDDPHPEAAVYEILSPDLTRSTYKRRDGTVFIGELASGYFTQANGKRYAVSIIRDITKREQAEEVLKEAYDILEKKVKERTAELEEAYKALLENERRLSEVQKMAHIGIWDWDLVTNQKYWSEEMYRIYGCNPQGSSLPYNEFLNCIHPHDRDFVDNATKEALKGKPYAIDFRIVLANGEERIIHSRGEAVFNEKNTPVRIRGAVLDITERKRAERALAKIEIARKKEIHHRIKNNLQVISSLLDLQAEKFNNKEYIKDSEVLEAFRESQNRVMSIALIHEELHEVGGEDVLNFSLYLGKLVDKLFLTYRLGDIDISLNADMEENLFFDMDTAIPLGIIINELISNSLKHAFIGRDKGEIRITLRREETGKIVSPMEESKSEGCKSANFILAVSDNGVGIPENLDTKILIVSGFNWWFPL